MPQSAAALTDEQLREGQMFWAGVDSPWIHEVDDAKLAKELDGIRAMKPEMILSSHLSAAPGDLADRMLTSLAAVPATDAFVGPDQAALQRMLQEMAAGGG